MTKIAIIGNSAAGFSCCQALVKSPADDLEIVVISQEPYPAYKKNLLLDYLGDKIKEEELFLCREDFYPGHKINFLKNSKVIKVDPRKKAIILKDNNRVNYDYLVVAAGEKTNIPDIPGDTKDGVFTFSELQEVKKIKERLALGDTVTIVGDAQLSLGLWEAVAPRGKEVKIICSPRPQNFLPTTKVEWIENLSLTELIGEGAELKAFKLSNGKVVGTALVLFIGNRLPATDFLKESGIKMREHYVLVDDGMRTSLENVFACGSVCRKENSFTQGKSWEDAVNEGILAATNLFRLRERGKTTCQTY